MMQISSMYIGHEEDFNFILFNHFQSKCPLGTGPWWPLYMNTGARCVKKTTTNYIILLVCSMYVVLYSIFFIFFLDAPSPCVYEWHCSHACTSTLVMGRTLDLPSVIGLAPCKYKRVYFYFGVQKKLIFIYLFFFYFYFLGPIWLSFWGRFNLGPIWLMCDHSVSDM